MTRATRSQTVQPQKSPDANTQFQSIKKLKESKKRKRGNVADDEHEDARLKKQARRASSLSDAEGPSLDPDHAQAILLVLEEIDSQGLLDREFPPSDVTLPNTRSYSLRSLLQGSGNFGIKKLQAAVEPLRPISTHPRHQLSEATKQQLNFCELASRLIDQAIQHCSSRISLSSSYALPDSEDGTDGDISERPDTHPLRRYSLMQKLPSGEYWTSLSSIASSGSATTSVACAQRVAILPSLPPPAPARATLGSLEIPTKVSHKFKSLHLYPRQLSQGSFLDYGSYTSFAPSWDSEGAEIGRDCVGACLEDRKLRRNQRQRLTDKPTTIDLDPQVLVESTKINGSDEGEDAAHNEDESSLDVTSLFESLEVEAEADRLLEENAQAVERLRYLQQLRLLRGEKVIRDQLEHSTAAALEASLNALLVTRPRNVGLDSGKSLVSVPKAELRRLRAVIPLQSSSGWQGTLADSRAKALRDDTTVITKPGTTATKPVVNATTANTATTTPYRAGYSYYPLPTAGGQANYYPSYYAATPATGTGTGSQTPYPYPTWGYSYPSPGQKGSLPTTPTAGYSGYYSMNTPAAQRAVANTAKSTTQQQVNGWAGSAALPAHMRRSVAAIPSTPLKQVQHAPSTPT